MNGMGILPPYNMWTGKGFMYNNGFYGYVKDGSFVPDKCTPSVDGWMLSRRAHAGGKYYYPLCLITF